MELDKAGVARAVFRFHALRRCCVSEDVFLDIVKRPLESTNSICRHLQDAAAQKFINDAMQFLLQLKNGNVAAESTMQIEKHLVGTPSCVCADSKSSCATIGTATNPNFRHETAREDDLEK
jgi:hypothetical protein